MNDMMMIVLVVLIIIYINDIGNFCR